MLLKKLVAFLPALLLPCSLAWAVWVWSPESGKFVNPEGALQDTAEEQYDYAMRFYKEKDLEEASDQLENLLKKFPGARIAPEAQYRLGTVYEERADYWKAFRAYKTLVESYPQSERFNEVVEREFRIGNLFLSGKKAKLMGLEILPSLPRAAEIFQHIVQQAPYSEYGDRAQFHLGLTYQRWKRFAEAVEAFQTLIDQYPQSDLVGKARYQLAEASFQQSAAQFRDQRALEEASKQVDRFLERHPDAEATEKAAKLRQAIDEKNAEKNYRIGVYYEKEDYIESALIYYRDVGERYPHTRWGEKALSKLKALEQPVTYLSEKGGEIKALRESLEARLERISRGDEEERKRIQKELKQLKEDEKSFKREKVGTLEARDSDIRRRERELGEKFKRLEKKRKLAEKHPSPDYQRAMERWHASLVAEQEALIREKGELRTWRESLGVKERRSPLEMLPFVGEEESELDKVRKIGAKKLYHVAEEKKSLLEEKEALYKKLGEVSSFLDKTQAGRLGLYESLPLPATGSDRGSDGIRTQRDKVKNVLEEVQRLEADLEGRRKAYESQFGEPAWLMVAQAPARLVARSAGVLVQSIDKSFSFVNPFDDRGISVENASLEELKELALHMREKIAAQQNLTDTLTQAFDAELALQEQKRLLSTLESGPPPNPMRLRKSVKALEKDIRTRYQEIDDRHRHKKALLEELDGLLGKRGGGTGMSQRGSAFVLPVARTGWLVKSFLFGLPDRDVELTKEAGRLAEDGTVGPEAQRIKEEIELESLMIEAQSREIENLEKELEILRAKASLAGGFKFRSAIVRVPYKFLGEAINSSKRLIPRKDRDEILIQRLGQETQRLEAYRHELRKVEERIGLLTPKSQVQESREKTEDAAAERTVAQPPSAEEKPSAESEPVGPEPMAQAPDPAAMKSEIESVIEKIAERQRVFEREKMVLEEQLRALELPPTAGMAAGTSDELEERRKREEELQGELREVRRELTELIRKEGELELEETEVLEKRISHIDRAIQQIQSKALTQDLLAERGRMEERLSQISLRQGFLTKEIERFQLADTGSASG